MSFRQGSYGAQGQGPSQLVSTKGTAVLCSPHAPRPPVSEAQPTQILAVAQNHLLGSLPPTYYEDPHCCRCPLRWTLRCVRPCKRSCRRSRPIHDKENARPFVPRHRRCCRHGRLHQHHARYAAIKEEEALGRKDELVLWTDFFKPHWKPFRPSRHLLARCATLLACKVEVPHHDRN